MEDWLDAGASSSLSLSALTPGNKLWLVCKSWKGTVDHFLEDGPSLRPHDLEKYDPRRLDIVNPMKEKQLGQPYDLTFNNSTYLPPNNPTSLDKWKRTRIIGRALSLRLGNIKPDVPLDGDNDEGVDGNDNDVDVVRIYEDAHPGSIQQWKRFYQFLNHFGKDIWYLNIRYGHDPNETNARAKEWDRKLLPFMTADIFRIFPQLRKLSIVQKGEHIEERVNLESLPSAPNLETFESNCYVKGIGPIVLTRYHNQLRCLNVTVETWRELNPLDWPTLKELHLNSFYEDDDFQNLWGGLRLPQLVKLGMTMEFTGNTGLAVGFQSLLRVVRELSAIAPVSILRLEGLRGLHKVPIQGSCYALSNVKTIEFNHRTLENWAPCYHFLLQSFHLLENLNVFIRNVSHLSLEDCPETDLELLPWTECVKYKSPLLLGREQEIVDVNEYLYDRAMYKSNIWELMPLLKVFSFQWDVYTRHEYQPTVSGEVKGATSFVSLVKLNFMDLL